MLTPASDTPKIQGQSYDKPSNCPNYIPLCKSGNVLPFSKMYFKKVSFGESNMANCLPVPPFAESYLACKQTLYIT